MHDVIFLSYLESNADANWERLRRRIPHAKRVHGVTGIRAAHLAAAYTARTESMFVIDGDAEILPEFDFAYQTDSRHENMMVLWPAINAVNGLVYGYGGVKLINRKRLLDAGEPSRADFTTSIHDHLLMMETPACITAFNHDPFSAWRAGFRECAKLASASIPRADRRGIDEWLNVWCTVGQDALNGRYTIDGANQGRAYGIAFKDDPEQIKRINDFDWLSRVFHGVEQWSTPRQ